MKRLLLISMLAGCVTSRAYVLDGAAWSAGAALVPGVREKDGRAVNVRAWTIDRASVSDAGGGRVRVQARAYNRKVVAGAVLTFIGSAISIAGTLMYLVADGGVKTAGFVLAPSAEPIMITGTVLWVLGLIRPPMEARTGP